MAEEMSGCEEVRRDKRGSDCLSSEAAGRWSGGCVDERGDWP